MLLTVPERPVLPVGHLLLFAKLSLEEVLTDTGKTKPALILKIRNYGLVEILNFQKVKNTLVKLHLGTFSLEFTQVSAEPKSKDCRLWAAEDTGQHLVELQVVSEADHVDSEDVLVSSKLEDGNSVGLVPFGNLRAPLRINTNILLANKNLQSFHVFFLRHKLVAKVDRQAEEVLARSAHWLKEILRHLKVSLSVVFHGKQILCEICILLAVDKILVEVFDLETMPVNDSSGHVLVVTAFAVQR